MGLKGREIIAQHYFPEYDQFEQLFSELKIGNIAMDNGKLAYSKGDPNLAMEYKTLLKLDPINENGNTFLHLIAQFGTAEQCKLFCSSLQKEEHDINIKNNEGMSPLLLAVQARNCAVVKQLIEEGADIESENTNGETAFMLACKSRNEEIIDELCLQGADINTRDNNGETPLSISLKNGWNEFSEKLIKLGANINTKYKYNSRKGLGETVLHRAVSKGDSDLIKQLLKNRADPEIFNQAVSTPYLIDLLKNNFIHSKTDKLLKIADQGLTKELLYRKLLAHRFGIKGVSILANQRIPLEGLRIKTAIHYLNQSSSIHYNLIIDKLIANDTHSWEILESHLSVPTIEKLKQLGHNKIISILKNTGTALAQSLLTDESHILTKLDQG